MKSLFAHRSRSHYTNLWRTVEVLPSHVTSIARHASMLLENKERYVRAADEIVPWYVVGLVHVMEAGNNADPFARCLHNGLPISEVNPWIDPPSGPFSSFEESARDAMRRAACAFILTDDLLQDVAHMLAFIENWNGVAKYAIKGLESPYLWAGSNHGVELPKYRRKIDGTPGDWVDGVPKGRVSFYLDFDRNDQTGAAVIMKKMVDDGVISLPGAFSHL